MLYMLLHHRDSICGPLGMVVADISKEDSALAHAATMPPQVHMFLFRVLYLYLEKTK